MSEEKGKEMKEEGKKLLKQSELMSSESKWGQNLAEMNPEPHAESIVTQKVKIECSEMFDEMAKMEVDEIRRCMKYTTTVAIPEEEDMVRYFKTLIYLRCLAVENPSLLKGYSYARKLLNIPTRAYQILASVGIAVDRTYGIRFQPYMDIEASDLMSPDELRDFSDKIGLASDEGYLLVETGLPREPSGELGTMACMLVADEKIYSYRKDHVVYGFIASFFKTQVLNSVFEPGMYRIYYGTVSDFKTSLRNIYR